MNAECKTEQNKSGFLRLVGKMEVPEEEREVMICLTPQQTVSRSSGLLYARSLSLLLLSSSLL